MTWEIIGEWAVGQISSWIGFMFFGIIVGIILALFGVPVVVERLSKIAERGLRNLTNRMVDTFSAHLKTDIVPLLRGEMERTREALVKRLPTLRVEEKVLLSEEVEKYIGVKDFEAAFRTMEEREQNPNPYRELARTCMKEREKTVAFKATHKYLELAGEIAESYQFVGYVYDWFGDFDTAIIYTEKALGIAESQPSKKRDAEQITLIKNNLAFYYAEAGKPEYKHNAFKYANDAYNYNKENTAFVDTLGYVTLNLATTTEETDRSIKLFNKALELATLSEDRNIDLIKEHLKDAYMKKADIKKKQAT